MTNWISVFPDRLLNPIRPRVWSGKSVAIVGSGLTGLLVAVELNERGHSAVVFEKDEVIAQGLRGDPSVVDEDLDALILGLQETGITFSPGVEIGRHLLLVTVLDEFDAVFAPRGTLSSVNEHPRVFTGHEVDEIIEKIDLLLH